MDNDRAEGSMKTIKGRVKEGLGKALGDTKLETEGKMDKAEGKVPAGQKWPQFWSECNKRKKAEGM